MQFFINQNYETGAELLDLDGPGLVVVKDFHHTACENAFLAQWNGKSITGMPRRLVSDEMERRQVHLEWKMPREREIGQGKSGKGLSIAHCGVED